MTTSSLSHYVLAVSAAAAVLTGCSINAGGMTAPVPVQGVPAASNLKPLGHGKSSAYLYTTGVYSDEIAVYGYDGKTGKFGSEIGTISSGLSEPQGLCGDNSDVWVANTGTSQLLEFKAGSTKEIASLNDPGEYPAGCAISEKGDIAASNLISTADAGGNVVVYKGGEGSPTAATCPNVNRYYFLAYDTKGNIWVDGEGASSAFAMCEILAGETTGHAVELSPAPLFPGAVQWWHAYLTVGDQESSAIDAYSVKHFSGRLVKSVVFSSDSGTDISDYSIFGKYVVLANLSTSLASFKFPAAGAPVDTLQGVEAGSVVIVP